MKKAVFDIGDAGCLNCKVAVEHAARHIDGIQSIELDIGTHTIHVDYDSNSTSVIADVQEIVNKLGYDATLKEDYEVT